VSNQVYANNMEVSCKQAAGKSICAFPDVCMTPPQTPATPPGVPIPYPNTGMASDCTDGSTSVKISGQEVMLKNKSYFKKSTGDEAGSAPKKGLLTSKNTGKVYFIAWSMDVLAEGENVVRNLDMTTHNHGSCPGNTTPMAYIDEAIAGLTGACKKEREAVEKACGKKGAAKRGDPCPGPLGGSKVPMRGDAFADQASEDANSCAKAVKCFLRPYKSKGANSSEKENSCCAGQTGHHIPPWSTTDSISRPGSGVTKESALCICLEGTSHSIGSHGKHHHGINYLLKEQSGAGGAFTGKKKGKYQMYSGKMRDHIKVAAQVTEAQTDCSIECIQQQLEAQYEKDLDKNATHNASTTGGESYGKLNSDAKADLNTAQTDRAW
jgi:Domain of unknown function (DUF4150)/GHH signature containing HNH/Endo VII superfamily nuclease toxin  2